jgi:hypothetical protein
MLKDILGKVAAPGVEFRGIPFWVWSGRPDADELRRQLGIFREMGFGGAMLTTGTGLVTPYLSEEWFDLVSACVDEAKRLGLKLWIYDEDRWPSGAAGGLVTRDKRFRLRYIRHTVDAEFPPEEDSVELARYAVVLEGTTIVGCRRLRRGAKPGSGERLMVFKCMISPVGESWFNGQNYLDVLNPRAVGKFVAVTHEAYRRHLAREFGKVIPGFFTDEPNLYADSPVDSLPWTDGLEKAFRERYGYDLLDHLPELYYSRDDDSAGRGGFKTRLDYRNLVGDALSRAFGGTIGGWCRRNRVQMTGHVRREDSLSDQAQSVGSAMRFYEHMSMPGIDVLTEHGFLFNTAKQCSSAAHQLGRRFRITETGACTGWDMPFMGHKALGDWQYALGINFRFLMNVKYTFAGEAKRDFPVGLSFQSPCRKEYAAVEDYFARLGAALSEGEEQRDLLVIHPLESMLGSFVSRVRIKHNLKPDNDLDREFVRLTNELASLHLDFDFGDEELLSRRAAAAGGKFRVGKAAYRAVLLPYLVTVRATTLELLAEFSDRGGAVFYLDSAPEYLDGVRSARPERIYARFRRISEAELDRALSPLVRRVSIRNADATEVSPALYLLKKGRDFETLFVCNTGHGFIADQKNLPLVRDRRERFPEATIAWKLPENRRICQLDLNTGRLHRQPFARRDGLTVFASPLEPLESRLFFATAAEVAAAPPLRRPRPPGSGVPLPDTRCRIELDEPNVLILDTPAYRIDGGERHPPRFFLCLDDELRARLGAPPRGGRMVQPWARGKVEVKRRLDLELEYAFDCEAVPAGCRLALERPELYTAMLNDVPLDMTDRGWWCDRAIRLVDLPQKAFKKGRNTIVLVSKYDESLPGLESMYLLGDFGVRDDVLTRPVRFLEFGDWTTQGLPYYSGNLTYTIELPAGTSQLEFPKWRGAALACASGDGKKFTTLGWPPFTFRTGSARKVRVKVLGHRRNAMGPFFTADLWPWWTGPDEFRARETAKRGLVPCGILEPPTAVFFGGDLKKSSAEGTL